jgi:hypothetical protein
MDPLRWAHAATKWDLRISKTRTGRAKTRGAGTMNRVAGASETGVKEIDTTFIKPMLQTPQT